MVPGLDLGQLSADNATITVLLDRLQQYGEATLTFRMDNVVDLLTQTEITQGSRVPVVQDIAIGRNGAVTPSVTYQRVGAIIRMRGAWRDQEPQQADITCRIELSGIGKSAVTVSEGVILPVYMETDLTQTLTVTDGKPILAMLTSSPTTDNKQSLTTVQIRYLMLTRADATHAPAKSAAAAGPPTKIELAIYQLTGEKEKLETVDLGKAPPADAKKLEESLGWFGKVELVSRPSILAAWPSQSKVTIGWNEPVMNPGEKDKNETTSGRRPVSVRYERCAQAVEIEGRWSETNPHDGTVKLKLTERRPATKSRDAVDQTAITSEVAIQEGKPTCIMGKVLSDDGQDQAKRLIICLTARRIATGPAASDQSK
jgi:hypothetical protein